MTLGSRDRSQGRHHRADTEGLTYEEQARLEQEARAQLDYEVQGSRQAVGHSSLPTLDYEEVRDHATKTVSDGSVYSQPPAMSGDADFEAREEAQGMKGRRQQ
jgi:hypothetical protein